MEFLKKNINYIIFAIIVILMIIVVVLYFSKEKEVIKTFKNEGTQVLKIYTNKNPDKIFKKIGDENNSDKIVKILKENGVEKFILNNNGSVTAGTHYSGGKYAVSIVKNNKVTDIVYLENESLYINEDDNNLAAAINKSYNEAKKDAEELLEKKEIKTDNPVYLIKDKTKTMSSSFKQYLEK